VKANSFSRLAINVHGAPGEIDADSDKKASFTFEDLGFASGVSMADDCAQIRATNNNAAAPTKAQGSSLIKISSRKK
jgi:hypothetical protein